MLPAIDQEVLGLWLWRGEGIEDYAVVTHDGGGNWSTASGAAANPPTHWMPIPPAPKDPG